MPATKDETVNMKNSNKILFAAALAATLGLAGNASAQYKPTGDDGITASPRVCQMLNEREASARVSGMIPSAVVAVEPSGAPEGLAASPRVRQMLAKPKTATATGPAAEVTSAGYYPTGPEGITASPRLRQQLTERGTPFMVAPLK